MKDEEYEKYLKISKDSGVKVGILIFLICAVTTLFYSIFVHIVIYFSIFWFIMLLIILVIYKIDIINWEVTKGKFTIINKNELEVTLIDMERQEDKQKKNLIRLYLMLHVKMML